MSGQMSIIFEKAIKVYKNDMIKKEARRRKHFSGGSGPDEAKGMKIVQKEAKAADRKPN